jgi:hypothetical protein
LQERNWVCVEGLNCRYDIQGKTEDFPGVMQRIEEPLDVLTEIKLVDPTDERVCDDYLKEINAEGVSYGPCHLPCPIS